MQSLLDVLCGKISEITEIEFLHDSVSQSVLLQ